MNDLTKLSVLFIMKLFVLNDRKTSKTRLHAMSVHTHFCIHPEVAGDYYTLITE
jgi:hypothetical protein